MFNLYKITEEDLAVLREGGFLENEETCKVERDVLKSGFECYKVGFENKEDKDRAYKALLEITEEEINDVKNSPKADKGQGGARGGKAGGHGNAGGNGGGRRRRRK